MRTAGILFLVAAFVYAFRQQLGDFADYAPAFVCVGLACFAFGLATNLDKGG